MATFSSANVTAALRGLAALALKRWKLVALGLALGAAAAVVQLRRAPYFYASQVVVMQVIDASGGPAQLGGLSLGTMSLNQSALQFQLFVDSVRSRDVAEDLTKVPGLMQALFAGWDPRGNSWRQRPLGLGDHLERGVGEIIGLPPQPWQSPDAAQLQAFITQNVIIAQDPKKKGLVILNLTSTSPLFARNFLSALVHIADAHFRAKALQRARQNIDYLNGRLDSVTADDQRQALMAGLSDQETQSMTAAAPVPAAADVFDAPFTIPQPVFPVARLIFARDVAIGGLLGLLVGFVLERGGWWLRRKVHFRFAARYLRVI
jgi:hypothetical protein